jgi:hypothetical protein
MEGSGTAVEPMTMPATGGRRHRSLKKVSAKTIRRTLRKAGIKPKGRMVLTGGVALGSAPVGGMAHVTKAGRRRGTRRGRKSRRSLFGMIKY